MIVTEDEEYKRVNFDKFKTLKAVFQREGGKGKKKFLKAVFQREGGRKK